jgi:outer membrane immunogenic protein
MGFNRIGAATFAAALLTGTAFAADLPSLKGPPVYIPPPMFSWTGFYAGVNLGYGFGNNDPDYGAHSFVFHAPAQIIGAGAVWAGQSSLSGVIGGGQIGYNYQFNPWLVVGFETDIQGADLRSHSFSITTPDLFPVPHFGTAYARQSVDWFGTVRGRIGVTPFDARLLIYGTGGFAYGGVNHLFQYADNFPALPASLFGSTSYSNTKTGWTAGGGVEYAPLEFPNWSLKAEYLYVDLGKTNLATSGAGLLHVPFGTFFITAPGFFVAAHNPATRFHVVRVGVNYHFNLFGLGPAAGNY